MTQEHLPVYGSSVFTSREAGLNFDSLDSPGSLDFKVTVCTENSVLQWVQEKSPSLSSFFSPCFKGENSNF